MFIVYIFVNTHSLHFSLILYKNTWLEIFSLCRCHILITWVPKYKGPIWSNVYLVILFNHNFFIAPGHRHIKNLTKLYDTKCYVKIPGYTLTLFAYYKCILCRNKISIFFVFCTVSGYYEFGCFAGKAIYSHLVYFFSLYLFV